MCGIVGFIGNKNAAQILLNGLHRLEYKGYDSAGMALVNNGNLNVYKCAGRVADWATHGEPNDCNAHPHISQSGRIATSEDFHLRTQFHLYGTWSELSYSFGRCIEIKARGGRIVAIVAEGDAAASQIADYVINVPSASEFLMPVINSIPLQLLAYYIAINKGRDVDKPRNLAKSVTVE